MRTLITLVAMLLATSLARAEIGTATLENVSRQAKKTIRVLAYDGAVASGTYILVNPISAAATQFITAADEVRVKAGGNPADTAAGNGCREVTFCGLDENWDQVCEAEATAGANASGLTTAKFWRVNLAYCSASGTSHGANTGAISVETEAGTLLEQIEAGVSDSRPGHYSVPDDHTAYLAAISITVDDTTEQADVRVMTVADQSDVSAPVKPARIVDAFVNVGANGPLFYTWPLLPSFSEKSDVWVEASGTGGASEVTVTLYILLVKED